MEFDHKRPSPSRRRPYRPPYPLPGQPPSPYGFPPGDEDGPSQPQWEPAKRGMPRGLKIVLGLIFVPAVLMMVAVAVLLLGPFDNPALPPEPLTVQKVYGQDARFDAYRVTFDRTRADAHRGMDGCADGGADARVRQDLLTLDCRARVILTRRGARQG